MGRNPYSKDGEEWKESESEPAAQTSETDVETNVETGTETDAKKKKDNKKNKSGKTPEKRKTLYVLLSTVLAVVCFLMGGLATWFSLDKEMRSLVRLKDKIQEEYYEDITDKQFYDTIFNSINGTLLDDYSWYMTSDEYKDMRSSGKGNKSGIGVTVRTQDETGAPQIRILSVCGNSPAEASGLLEGDLILGYGKTESDITNDTVFDHFTAFLEMVEDNQTFYVKIQRGGESKVLPLYKAHFKESYVFYRTSDTAYRFTGNKADKLTEGGEPLAALPQKAAYIRLTQFNGEAAEQFDEVMERFQTDKKQDLILDLRGNGGGYLDILEDIASYFCKTADERRPVVAVADYGEYKEEFYAKGNYYYDYFTENSRICVLADMDSASASECLIGCMLDYEVIEYGDICLSERNGIAKTYGKGIMQTTYPLSIFGGDAVKLTTAKICWPKSGNCIHGRGVLPEDGAKVVLESYEKDAEITAAVSVLYQSATV